MVAGMRLGGSLCIHNQAAESHECSARFVLFIQFSTAAHGLAPPVVGRPSHLH